MGIAVVFTDIKFLMKIRKSVQIFFSASNQISRTHAQSAKTFLTVPVAFSD